MLPVLFFRLASLAAFRLLATTDVPLPEGELGGCLVKVALGEEGAQPAPLQGRQLGAETAPPRWQPRELVVREDAESHFLTQELADDALLAPPGEERDR